MTKHEADVIGALNMTDQISNEAYKQIMIAAEDDESPEWIPVDWEKYPEGYPRPFQEVWVTDEFGYVWHMCYGGKKRIKAWMPYFTPKAYGETYHCGDCRHYDPENVSCRNGFGRDMKRAKGCKMIVPNCSICDWFEKEDKE